MNYGNLPTYEEAIQKGNHDSNSTGSSYSIVTFPNIPHENTVLKPLPSNVKVKVSVKGASSKDPRLNSDPELLHSFFCSNNSKPHLWVNIKGFELETIIDVTSTTDADGNTCTTTNTRTEERIHFQLSLEVTKYISDTGMIQFIKQSHNQTLSKLFEDYVKDENKLKTFKIKKEVNWDYQTLTRALTYLIQSRGFRHEIKIDYELKNTLMKVSSNSKTARCLSHPFTRGLCILSCLCVVAWPIAKMYQKSYGKQLVASFPVRITPQQLYQNNKTVIISIVDNYIAHSLKMGSCTIL